MRRSTAPFLLAILALSGSAPAWAAGFATPTSVTALSEGGATVADGQPVSSLGDNPAAMVFFPGNRAALEVLAQRPSYKYAGPGGSIGAQTQTSILPNLFYSHRFSALPLSAGVAITSPYSIRDTWAPGALGSNSPYLKNSLRVLDISPSVAYLLLPDLSVGVGLDYYQTLGGHFGPVSANGGGVGGNFSLFYTTETLNAALSYRSPVSISAGGGHLDLPGRVQAGLRYRWTKAFATELDVDWTDWSNAQLPYYGSLHWKSSLAYRLGLSYHLNQDLALRAGIAHEGNPSRSDAVGVAIPATSSNLAGFGLGIGLGPWHYDIAAAYAFSGSTGLSAYTLPGSGGFSVAPGSYKASAFTFGAGISRSF